ncbi:pilus assembly protein [Vibrio sp.]|nr:pilus assembly protein [Vibrio sp.]
MMKAVKLIKKQHGLTTVEFTVIATTLFLIVFALIELGIYIYSVQTLNDMSRKATRLGAVCYPTADISGLVTDGAPLGIQASNIQVDYLDGDSAVINLSSITDTSSSEYSDAVESIRYVRAQVVGFTFTLSGILSFLGNNGVLSVPTLESILPIESLGISHDGSFKDNCN